MENTWIEEMKEAMKAISKACSHNPDWTECYFCPFYVYCNAIEADKNKTPDGWKIED